MAISFNQVPVNLRVPGVYIEIDPSRAYRGLNGLPTQILVIGQRLSTSPLPALTLERFTRVDQAIARCGNSMLGHMLAALLSATDWLPVYAIGLDDNGAGVAATGSIEVTGATTEAGTLSLYIGGSLIQVGVASGAVAADIATDIAAAINAADNLLVTAVATDATVALEFVHKGECGNSYDVRHSYHTGQRLPAGLTLTIAPMGSVQAGSGNPLIQPALDLIGDEWFTDLVCPYTDAVNLAAARDKAAADFGPLVMQDMHVWTSVHDTFGNLTTLGEGLNDPHLTVLGVNGAVEPPWIYASVLAAISAYYLTIDPARPLQTLILPGLKAPRLEDQFTQSERNQLLYGGIATYRATSDGQVTIERAITTYQQTVWGAADPSYLDVETLRTLAFLRYDLQTFLAKTFPRYKLANDGTNFGRGQAVVTPRIIRAAIVGRFEMWETAGLAEGIEQFKQDIIVERDQSDPNRVNCLVPPDLVNQLRVLAANMQFLL